MLQKDKYLILVGGPTASGKTSLAIDLAQYYSCPILSADSRQFYREISIGTAKPTEEEMAAAKHYFINTLSIHDDYNVGQYERDAMQILDEVYRTHDVAIVVGGTGLYLRALIHGVDEFPAVAPADRDYFQQLYDEQGLAPLQAALAEADPSYYDQVDRDNPHRLIRALSVIRSSGEPFSSFLTSQHTVRPFISVPFCIQMDRQLLYDRINRRVDIMIQMGLIDEARSVYPYRSLNSLNTVGYKELFKYIDGEWSLEQAVDKIKQHSRNYAKRQMTWFKNQGNWTPIQDKEGAKRVLNDKIHTN